MKRAGYLFKQVTSFENLYRAAQRAFRGKKDRLRVAEFYFHLEMELLELQKELITESYLPRPYRKFEIREPKQREICAADFRDRVVHHAICASIDPIFERYFIDDCYACRVNKGTHRAVKRLQYFSRRYDYFLKCDVKKYFHSIDHALLKEFLRRKLKDPQLLGLLDTIIDHPIPGGVMGKGLPIGNLTSQYFANFYLSKLDHYLKSEKGLKGYLRYMDDFLLFDDQKERLHQFKVEVRGFLAEELKLSLKEKVCILAPVHQGIGFLGFRVYRNLIRLQGKNWRRFRKKVRRKEDDYRQGKIDIDELSMCVNSMIGHIKHANTHRARQRFFGMT